MLTATAILLSGCGATSILLKKEDKQNIKTIAIVKINQPTYQMVNKGSGAAAFGAIGGALIGSEADSLTGRLNKVIKKQKFNLNKELEKQLSHELKRVGYKVHFIKMKHNKENELFESYKKIKYSKANAILDVIIVGAGYATTHFMFSPEWRPEVKVSIALGKPGQENLLYSETIMYGYHNIFMSATDLDAPKKYMFDEDEDVFKAGDKVVIAGLKNAVQAIAQQIANRLKK